ncbi:MAG: cytochrome C, partial [Deltaproteobacteria bacterium]|nr:cytochrome C [Deltaproteobacteria bacterium]
SIMTGGHSGATADAVFDFVPDTTITKLPATKNIVNNDACQACHGPQFKGHGGDRLSIENCVTCHNPSTFDAQSKQSLDAKVMIHRIHAGGNLDSIAGPDGHFWNNTGTAVDESKDNGPIANAYALWGYGNNKISWYKAGFQAELGNCTKCHNGKGENVDAWKVASRAACGSCHDTVDFATGVNHKGGAQANDNKCSVCHEEGGFGLGVIEAHDGTKKDPRNIPEFNVELSMTPPKSGKTYYEAGDAPVVSIVLKDAKTGKVIDHTTMIEGASEGCWTGTAPTALPPATCQTANGKFGASAFFVHGPRAYRSPALTMAARAKILSTTVGPWDLSADPTPSLTVIFDAGQPLVTYDASGGDKPVAGTATVTLAASAYANKAAVTAAELVAAFNANAAFKARGIAYIDEATGKFGIRSRNLGKVFSVQFAASAFNTTVFAGNVVAAGTNSSTASNLLAKRTASGAIDDPKVTRATDKVTYKLDPVDDLPAGTYTISVEIGDRYRVDADNYVTPSVAFFNFNVKQAAEELPVARNCQTCHQNAEGHGLVVDPSRHNKLLRDLAVDQCGACHDYQPQNPKDATNTPFNQGWAGSRPISRRIHAIHNGSEINFPLQTVWYANGDPAAGRNWDIKLPADVRTCELCHTAKTTSGTWATKPGRLACWGCHDSSSAQAHFAAQTYDPTPADPWSGDEAESCVTCHK